MNSCGNCACDGQGSPDPTELEAFMETIGDSADKVIPLLQAVQNRYSYIPQEALEFISSKSGLSLSRLVGVCTFYSHFRLKPAGKHTIRVCVGTACHVKGSAHVIDALRDHLNISPDDDTDAERNFTIQPVACLGCCTLAPVVVIGDVTYGHVTPDKVPHAVRDFLANEESGKKRKTKTARLLDGETVAEVRVGLGSCCVAGGAGHVKSAVEQALEDFNAPAKVKQVGCVGMCHRTPLLEIVEPGKPPQLYANVTAKDTRRIIKEHFKPRGVLPALKEMAETVFNLALDDENWDSVERYSLDVRDAPVAAFLGPQEHVALEHCGNIDPTDIEDYLNRNGFEVARSWINERSRQDIIDVILNSGLRGRGGGGFPTGRKWQVVHDAESTKKYIVLNGDEGDPGAFMDRMLLESYPFRILEGMILAAYAVGADEAILYIREEYPLAVKRMRDAISICMERGFLGDKLLDSDFSLDIRIMEGAGAFVCGEETALIQSIQGHRGMPTARPPFPAEVGLYGKPTLVNNVETYANIPWIFRNGADAFASIGTETSKGGKVFALAGKIRRGGLIEVPMGITIRQIIEDIGGGIENGKAFKAVQIGGPSGGCIPACLKDTPIDFETLNSLGAIMGSGGLVVLDEDDCMVDMARYFMSFTQNESCGKCTPCRVGTRRMLEILNRLCEGMAKKGDLDQLEFLCAQVTASSLCGLGRTAPNPVKSTLKHFRDEYEAHINGNCPSGKCQALITYSINDNCTGCTKCAQVCPVDAIPIIPYKQHEIIQDLCTKCDACRQVCPENAVKIT